MKAVRASGLLVAGVASLVSCAGGSEADVATARAPGRELPAEVADRLTWEAPRVPPEVAADGDAILLAGGLDVDEADGRLRLPSSALLVDTAAGTATEVAAPRSGTPVHVSDVATDRSGFVVVGSRCDDAGFGLGEYECLPGSGASFRLDPGTGAWRELPLPPEVAPTDPGRSWSFQPELGSAPDGRAFMIVRAGPFGPSGPRPVRLLVLDGDRWLHVADLPADLVVDACASADGVYVLSRLPGDTVLEGPLPPAKLQLVRVDLDGGAPVPVDLPDIDTSIAGVAVTMACDEAGPYLTSAPPDATVDLALYAWRDGTWTRIDGDWGNTFPVAFTSGADGVALVVDPAPGSGEAARAFTVAAGATSATALGDDSGLRRFEPDPATGGFVALGPLARPRAADDAPDPARDAPMSALAVEP